MAEIVPETGSLRAFSRRIGVTDTAVRKAIRSKRLKACLGQTATGRPMIADMALAEREWSDSSKTSAGVRTGRVQTGSRLETQAPGELQQPMLGNVVEASTLFEAQRLATLQRERKLRLDNDVTEGRLIPLDRVTKEAFEAERIIRENILNLPARIAGELHAERDPARFYLKFEAALREALNLAADVLQASANG